MKYQNPIMKADYSDPDVLRVGSDYYMISSSFTYFPGMPLLHSKDLVHWRLVNYIAKSLPYEEYNVPCHNRGTWAPSIRYHNDTFYVYVCAPDEGLFAFTAKDPLGQWECHLVKDVTGWIDPCPLWDDDGNAYLLHAFAGSRAGIKSILYLHTMSDDGLTILDTGHMVFDGTYDNETTEGPKFYKIGGKYFILAPAGGVATGWQLAMRADNPYGPYEVKTVLAQKDTQINGPHQGGLIDTQSGQWWFIHFQDVDVYGRIPHLQPVNFVDGWPIMGIDGAPVMAYDMPDTGFVSPHDLPTADDFTGDKLALQWQFQANPNPAWYEMMQPGLRLNCAQAPHLFGAGQYLSQLMQCYHFTWQVEMETHFVKKGDLAGLAMMGYEYAYLAAKDGALIFVKGSAVRGARDKIISHQAKETACIPLRGQKVSLQMQVIDRVATFAYSQDGTHYTAIGEPFHLAKGGWTGARPGIFAGNFEQESKGYAIFKKADIKEVQP